MSRAVSAALQWLETCLKSPATTWTPEQRDAARRDLAIARTAMRRSVADELEAGAFEDARQLGELLAVIHGDGGHYQIKHGTAKAVADAMALWHARSADAERYRAALQTIAAECGNNPHTESAQVIRGIALKPIETEKPVMAVIAQLCKRPGGCLCAEGNTPPPPEVCYYAKGKP